MPTVEVLQHLYTSVEKGFSPRQGRGFQTVAVSAELAGTEDLAALERASFYSLSRERRDAGDRPVREVYFRLPSGRFAIGRTVDWGTDALGRDGNYLAHHLIIECRALVEAGSDAFAVLDAARLAEPEPDLAPRELPRLSVDVVPRVGVVKRCLESFGREYLAALGASVVEEAGRTTLAVTRDAGALFRGLTAALAPEDRLPLTFCTHFSDSEHLRALFRVAAVGFRAELPDDRQEYAVFDPDAQLDGNPPKGAYARWISGCLRRDFDELEAFNAALDALRRGNADARLDGMSPEGRALLWEREKRAVAARLTGNARLIAAFLPALGPAREVTEVLLREGPDAICGAVEKSEDGEACLRAIRDAAPRGLWRAWARKWRGDPRVADLLGGEETWLRSLLRRLPGRAD